MAVAPHSFPAPNHTLVLAPSNHPVHPILHILLAVLQCILVLGRLIRIDYSMGIWLSRHVELGLVLDWVELLVMLRV
jgi:hypothetical protein